MTYKKIHFDLNNIIWLNIISDLILSGAKSRLTKKSAI